MIIRPIAIAIENAEQGGEYSQEKYRERRRRRIEVTLLPAISASYLYCRATSAEESAYATTMDGKQIIHKEPTADPQSSSSASSGEEIDAFPASLMSPEEPIPVYEAAPVFGLMSIAGRSREMEDTVFAITHLCRPEISRRRPVHFFGVYDGHGGVHVAALCRDRMHVLMKEELMRVGVTGGNESGSSCSQGKGILLQEPEEALWRGAIRKCFERMDKEALSTCPTCPCGSAGYQCGRHPMEVALAVVAVLTADKIVVANCGDSRAVLCRAGKAIPLSSDHKPDRADELARIQASGGRVTYVNGARVEGILAMSRALGDKYLKPIVTCEPEICFAKRDPEDECLILASDGLWDVMSNKLACEVASKCLQEGSPTAALGENNAEPLIEDGGGTGLVYPSWSASAAALLTLLALGRKSSDNISVIVVDLRRS